MDSQQKKYEELLARNKRMKRSLLLVLTALLGLIILITALLLIFYYAFPEEEAENEPPKISFSEPYRGDIFEFEEYLSLDRSITYFDGSVYRSVNEENRGDFDPSLLLLCDLLTCMTKGDAAAYNALFNENPGQAAFSQQMIYETTILYVDSDMENGDRLFTYRLEYKIHRNDGTLRRDVGSDGMRPQWAVVRVREGGIASLEQLSLTAP